MRNADVSGNPDTQASFYCGDLAGRVAGWRAKAKRDQGDTDR